MATTTKTLSPTNQTITLPDMTERPNASVLVTDIGRNTDAINALSDGLNALKSNIPTFKSFQISANSSITLTITGRCVITAIGADNGRNMYICRVAGGALTIDELGTSSKISTSISGTNLTLTSTETTVVFLYATIYSGDVSVPA